MVGGLGPDEGFRVAVVVVELVVDRLLKLGDAPEDAAPDAFGRDLEGARSKEVTSIRPHGSGRYV